MFGFDIPSVDDFGDERAVSPVIGVILMVAVVVVLAAVVTGFVFGIGDDLSSSQPTVDLEFDYDATEVSDGSEGTLDVVHDGGNALTSNNVGSLQLTRNNNPVPQSDISDAGELSGIGDDKYEISSGEQLTANELIMTWQNGANMNAGDEIELVWASEDGSSSEVLGSFELPVDSDSA